jgi:RNA-directed DNA polymerase
MQYTDIDSTWQKLALISKRSGEDSTFQFSSLAHLLNEEYLKDCFRSLNRYKATGIDNVTWWQYHQELDKNISQLVDRLKRKSYKPLPAKRVYIPKNETEKRPLGIPALENKIVERGITTILEKIYEQDFLNCSYGFRPRRSCHQALKQLNTAITNRPTNHIVEADIKGFFDNVSHEYLMEFIKIRVIDTTMLNLIRRFLKAGYVDSGLLVQPDAGTPQGSILSPLLANIFLHYILDKWFEDTVSKEIVGYSEIIRYADDFVCTVQNVQSAKYLEYALKVRFEAFNLEIHPTKSRRLSFGRYEVENAKRQQRQANTFDFLGFTHYCTRSRKGRFKVGRKTSQKKFKAKCKAMNLWLKTIRNKFKCKEWWKTLAAKLRGHYQYYGVSENYRGIERFYKETIRLLRKWLNRRSQKRKMSWVKLWSYLEKYTLPKPRIVHSFYVTT